MIEIGQLGTEYYIILDGEVKFYDKFPETQDGDRIRLKRLLTRESPIAFDPKTKPNRLKSEYEGVPKKSTAIKTEIIRTEGGHYVLFEGRMLLNRPADEVDQHNGFRQGFWRVGIAGVKSRYYAQGLCNHHEEYSFCSS